MLGYSRIENRCAFDLADAGCSPKRAVHILKDLGCEIARLPGIVGVARAVTHREPRSTYRRGADISEAPEVFDCSSLIQWVWAQVGLWLPNYAFGQRRFLRSRGWVDVPLAELSRATLVFTTGLQDHWDNDPRDSVGHAGIITGEETVIHAAGTRRGVVEDEECRFFGQRKRFRGALRAPSTLVIVTLQGQMPGKQVQTSDDLVRKIRSRPDFSHG